MTGLNDIRTAFLSFFERNDHEIVPSSPLVPQNDPTLLFTNAGMVPFKNVFTGAEKRDYVRATSSQKCVRAGGKHNDLDNVGYTARHHTFFEMLGNFSFGDYFKERAIALAWELITKDYAIDPGRLVVTVFAEDDEAHDLWKKISGFSDEKIIRIPTSDNFWSMGETGPCGPCSEIFFDHGDHIPGGPPGSADEDGDRFVEIWNLVFMQYDQVTKDERVDLPKPSIDTGMGLERIAAVLQGTHDNYETDLFKKLIGAGVEHIGARDEGENQPHYRVIADHMRATGFLIADGVLPSNEGRGYVLRRIMRRAMRHAHMLGTDDPVLWQLVPTLVAEMGGAFPELIRAQSLITETLKLEEDRFQKMLGRGLSLLDDATQSLGEGDELSGETAFKLYDTYGFPLDLTQDALREKNISVDTDGFEQAMARQKQEARAAWSGSGEAATDEVWFAIREEHGPTDFLGYSQDRSQGQLLAIVADGKPVQEIADDQEAALVFNQTPFYGESGGQVGDVGLISFEGGYFVVEDTQKKLGDIHVHMGRLRQGTLALGTVADLEIDRERRTSIRSNHSATHLLHAALRSVLGDHVTQKGSMVSGDRLRFDFSHPKAVSAEEIAAIEDQVNLIIRQNEDVSTRVMSPEDAVAAGALALFGEKYGDEVRVLTMGTEEGDRPYSVELCGGTHVRRVGDIGLFKIVSESAVASGVRRIEALTGHGARRHLDEQLGLLQQTAAVLKTNNTEVPARVAQLLEERKKFEREVADLKKQLALGGGQAQETADAVQTVNGVKFIASQLDGVSPKDLRGLIDDGKKKLGTGVVAFVAVNEGRASLAVGVTADLVDKVNAVELVKVGAAALGGKGGGGRPDMAQAGGPNGADADQALGKIAEALEQVA